MTENNEYTATPEQQPEVWKTEVISELSQLDYNWRYVSVGETPVGVLTQAKTSIEKYSVPRQRAYDVLHDWLEANKDDADVFTASLIELVEPLAEALGVDVEIQEEATVEARFTVYYSRKPWEEKTPFDSSDLSVSIEGNYGFELSDWSTDYIEVN